MNTSIREIPRTPENQQSKPPDNSRETTEQSPAPSEALRQVDKSNKKIDQQAQSTAEHLGKDLLTYVFSEVKSFAKDASDALIGSKATDALFNASAEEQRTQHHRGLLVEGVTQTFNKDTARLFKQSWNDVINNVSRSLFEWSSKKSEGQAQQGQESQKQDLGKLLIHTAEEVPAFTGDILTLTDTIKAEGKTLSDQENRRRKIVDTRIDTLIERLQQSQENAPGANSDFPLQDIHELLQDAQKTSPEDTAQLLQKYIAGDIFMRLSSKEPFASNENKNLLEVFRTSPSVRDLKAIQDILVDYAFFHASPEEKASLEELTRDIAIRAKQLEESYINALETSARNIARVAEQTVNTTTLAEARSAIDDAFENAA